MLTSSNPIQDYLAPRRGSPLITSDKSKRRFYTIAAGLFVLLLVCFLLLYVDNRIVTRRQQSSSSSTSRTSGALSEEEESAPTCSLKSSAGDAVVSELTREDAGRATWKFLHIITDNLKQQNEASTEKALQLIKLVSELFPCPVCAKDFREILANNPYETLKSRAKKNGKMDYSMKHYMCDLHNIVNKKLGKPLFDCNTKNLDSQFAMTECY